jgi:arabinofuranosyltransferase
VTPAAHSIDAREERVLWIAAALVNAAQIAAFHRVRFDDAYITFRYGANLASGAGLVFNPGERIMGSTSPGESLLSALVFVLVGRDALPGWMAALGCVGWTLSAVFLYRIVRPALGALGAAAVATAVAVGAAGSAPWTPLETNLTAALTMLGIHLALTSRWSLAAVACAAATWMRPDACLVTLPLFVLCVRDRRRDAWKPAAIYVALLVPWIVFATRAFGTPLPQSAVRKFQEADLFDFIVHAATYVPLPYEPAPSPYFALVLWPLAMGGAVTLIRRDSRQFVLVAYGALHLVAYAVLRTNVAFRWHLYPAALVFLALVVTMLMSLEEEARHFGRAGAALVIAYGAYWSITFAIEAPHRFWFGRRDALYRDIAAYLRAKAGPSDVVHAEEVGTLGYYSGLTMNDNAGLITRDPNDILRRFVHGEPTRLRWLVMNDKQLDPLRVVYQRRPRIIFSVEGAKLWVVDLESPSPPN